MNDLIDEPMDRRRRILNKYYGVGMNVDHIVGSAIVTAPGIILASVKIPWVAFLLWVIGGIVTMAGSLSYVELGIRHGSSGGEAKYLRTAYPRPNNMASYLFSCMFIFAIRPGFICAILQSGSQYLWYTIKGYPFSYDIGKGESNGWTLSFSPFWLIKLIAVISLFIMTAYHMYSNRLANYINQTLAVMKLVTYSIIALAGIFKLIIDPECRANWRQSLDGETDIRSYSTSILLVMFAWDGWNNLNYSLDEFRNTDRDLKFSNTVSVIVVAVLYTCVNIAFISVVPGNLISNGDQVNETIAATFFRQLFKSEGVVRTFTGLVSLAVMGTASSYVWSGSRVIVVAAELGFFPRRLEILSYRHQLRDTPANALFAQFLWCGFIIFFVGSITTGAYTVLASFATYSNWIFYVITGIGLLLIRYREYTDPTAIKYKKYKVPLFVTGIFISAGFFILTFSFVIDNKCQQKNCMVKQMAPLFVSYAFLFVPLMFYFITRRDRQILT